MCICAKSLQSRPTLWDAIDYSSPASSVFGDSPGKNIGVGCHALLQGIFLTQGSNPSLFCLLDWQVGSLPVHDLGSSLIGLSPAKRQNIPCWDNWFPSTTLNLQLGRKRTGKGRYTQMLTFHRTSQSYQFTFL